MATTADCGDGTESPASVLLRTHSMSLELYDAFHAWCDPSPGPVTVEDEVELFRADPRFLSVLRRAQTDPNSPMPDPARYVRKPFRSHQSTGQVAPRDDERILSGCGLSSSSCGSSKTELLESPSAENETIQFEFSDLGHHGSEPVAGRKRKEPCGGEDLEEGEVCL